MPGAALVPRARAPTAPPPTFQSRFDGSDRQGRGRLVDALRAGPVAWDDVPAAMGWPEDRGRAYRVLDTLIADGLADATGPHLSLANGTDRVS